MFGIFKVWHVKHSLSLALVLEGSGKAAELLERLCLVHEALGSIPSSVQIVVAPAWSHRTWEVETRGPKVLGYPHLQRMFGVSLGYMRACG